jgi:hypothetical protein
VVEAEKVKRFAPAAIDVDDPDCNALSRVAR